MIGSRTQRGAWGLQMCGEHLRERASGCGRAWGRQAAGTRHCPGGRNWTGTGSVGVGFADAGHWERTGH